MNTDPKRRLLMSPGLLPKLVWRNTGRHGGNNMFDPYLRIYGRMQARSGCRPANPAYAFGSGYAGR